MRTRFIAVMLALLCVFTLVSCTSKPPAETTVSATLPEFYLTSEIGDFVENDMAMTLTYVFMNPKIKPFVDDFSNRERTALITLISAMTGGMKAESVEFDSDGLLKDAGLCFTLDTVMNINGASRTVNVYFTPVRAVVKMYGIDTIFEYPFDYDGLLVMASCFDEALALPDADEFYGEIGDYTDKLEIYNIYINYTEVDVDGHPASEQERAVVYGLLEKLTGGVKFSKAELPELRRIYTFENDVFQDYPYLLLEIWTPGSKPLKGVWVDYWNGAVCVQTWYTYMGTGDMIYHIYYYDNAEDARILCEMLGIE